MRAPAAFAPNIVPNIPPQMAPMPPPTSPSVIAGCCSTERERKSSWRARTMVRGGRIMIGGEFSGTAYGSTSKARMATSPPFVIDTCPAPAVMILNVVLSASVDVASI